MEFYIMRCQGCDKIIYDKRFERVGGYICSISYIPIEHYRKQKMLSCPLGKFGSENTIIDNEHIELDEHNKDIAKQCLEICRQCEWYRPEKLTAENSDAPMPVRVVGNAIYEFFKTLGIEPFRCGKCGCFGSLKAKLLRGSGCPLKKWPNDVIPGATINRQ